MKTRLLPWLLVIGTCLALGLVVDAWGQTPVGEPDRGSAPELSEHPTRREYLAYAALHNAALESAFHRWQAALHRVPAARSLPDPRFTYGYYIQEIETRVGPQEHRVGLSQMFPWPGKQRLRGEAAEAEAMAAEQDYQAVKWKLFYRVKEAYHEYHYLGRAIAITEDNLRLLQHLESVARAKHRAGAPLSGVIKAQVELGVLDDRLRALRALQEPVVARLNAALNRPAAAVLPWPKETVPLEQVELSDDDLLRWLAETNPSLRALAAHQQQSEKHLALARKEYYPDITLGVDYIETGDALMAGTADSGKDPVIGMVSINLPIWRGRLRAGVDEALAQRGAAERAVVQQANELEAELKMVLYRYRDAARKINLYAGALLPQAEQSLEVTQQAYEAGAVDFLELIDAQRLLLQFQLDYERARADHHQRHAELEMLVGREIPGQPEE